MQNKNNYLEKTNDHFIVEMHIYIKNVSLSHYATFSITFYVLLIHGNWQVMYKERNLSLSGHIFMWSGTETACVWMCVCMSHDTVRLLSPSWYMSTVLETHIKNVINTNQIYGIPRCTKIPWIVCNVIHTLRS